ncbi:hypothetical protein [Pseudoalteromonas luteoviolacea]|uniref:Uncharacterized protein n=1 Tax=Pseudoalteromonas luteoviolacea DSM 6061 TaxID=1365250 RepID=A0A166VZ95_9GAMM|nr:hypothetical protein [Pseudoalteromonas luteoviolacea]KZN34829.1 hypothetical protein N475_18935 [Pseudoalteromonas luteoviolacea DSM 6061]KZN60464.1 hypothetical protein N474_25205 [Pseudoalteromonas luteoviolacea CPMOR-2]MBE0385483.1 hypothetical protein [Pseudoalteromonas luteoviolacea DSM 6061]TQF70089.1 hypothetical protein FLM44_03070 [Pseudoalteromonas luteoviolacea]
MKFKALILSALALSSMSASAYYNIQKKTWYAAVMGNEFKIQSTFGCINSRTMYESHRVTSQLAGLYPGQPYKYSHNTWNFKVYSTNSGAYVPGEDFTVESTYFTDSNNNYVDRILPLYNTRPYGIIKGIRETRVGGPNMINQFYMDLDCRDGDVGIIKPPFDIR